MIKIKVITNSKISNTDLNKVCLIKSVFGQHSMESQLNWIKNNLKPDDIHYLIYHNNKLIAYANLVNEFLYINEKKIEIFGIGNVCVDETGKNKGSLLLKNINSYLTEIDKVGLLFCKSKLVSFYTRNGWKSIKPDYTNEICWMYFSKKNLKIEPSSYRGKLF